MKIRALLIVAFRICGFATIGLLASQASAGDFYNDFSWLVDGKIVSTNTLLAAQTSITIAPGQTVSFSGTYYGEDLPPLYEATRSGTVFWGDGSQTNFSASLNSGAGGNVSTSLGTGSHVYQTPGIYQAGVTSECESHNGEPCGNILGIPVGYPLTVTVGSAQCNPPLTASLIDPVPDLVTTLNLALQGSVDVTSLSSKGRVVSGVSADGVTQAIVRVAASASGEVLQLTVSGDGSVGSVTRATVGSTVDVTATDTLLGPMAFAVYVAPKDFVRPGTDDDSHGSRNVTIQIKSLKTGCTLTLPVTIVRPPLALIHGVWSGPDTWNYFGVHMNNQLTLLKNDPRFNAFLINYKDTNGDGFLLNAYIVKGQIIQNLHSIKNGWNLLDIPIAAVQVDIVAHSMGGDLSRTMVTLPLYLTDTNYKQGWIHKLITIDTPHLGSEFANRLSWTPKMRQ